MNRRDFIKSIGMGICAGAVVPFLPQLLPEKRNQLMPYPDIPVARLRLFIDGEERDVPVYLKGHKETHPFLGGIKAPFNRVENADILHRALTFTTGKKV